MSLCFSLSEKIQAMKNLQCRNSKVIGGLTQECLDGALTLYANIST